MTSTRQPGAAASSSLDERRGLGDVLEVVEHEQRPAIARRAWSAVGDPLRPLVDAEPARSRAHRDASSTRPSETK